MRAFLQGLQHLGWVDGRNVRIEARWTVGKADNVHKDTAELAALAPDVIVVTGSASLGALLQTTHAMPIVFAQVFDPVGAGFVESLARPGGNATGFTQFEYGFSAKWLELLKEIAPSVTRAAILRDPGTAGIGQWAAIQTVAPALGVELQPIDVRDPSEFERAVAAFARASNGGLIVTGSGSATVHRQMIIMLAARHNCPRSSPFASSPTRAA